MSNSKWKRNKVTFETKLDAIKLLDEGKSIIEVAAELGIGAGSVQKVKNRNPNCCLSLKISRLYIFSVVNILFWRWFYTARGNGYHISGPILQEKSLCFARALESIDDFKASNGWLDKWRKRHNAKS